MLLCYVECVQGDQMMDFACFVALVVIFLATNNPSIYNELYREKVPEKCTAFYPTIWILSLVGQVATGDIGSQALSSGRQHSDID